jgi:hypothetical protein
VRFTHQFSSEAYVSFSFNCSRLGIAFATVNVLDSSASLNVGKQLILYHRYFCSLPAHLPPPPRLFTSIGWLLDTLLVQDSYLGKPETVNRAVT